MFIRSLIAGGALAVALSLPAQAAVLNPGFETGDLTAWTGTGGLVSVVTTAADYYESTPAETDFSPTEGSYFAALTAGDADVYTLLSQGLFLDAASKVSFDAAFLAFDSASDDGNGGFDYNDDGYVRIYSTDGSFVADGLFDQTFFKSDVVSVGDYGNTGWVHVTTGFLTSGHYVLEAGVRNVTEGGPDYSSKLLLDNVTTAVPEPATWALMLMGFGGLGAVIRRRTLRTA